MIIVGLGSGRSGTASLAMLLNSQSDALCFHELAPSLIKFTGTPKPIVNTIDEFQAIMDGGDPSLLSVDLSRLASEQSYAKLCGMKKVSLIGDIAFYYLSYVAMIAERNANVRFVCLKRDKEKTVESWMRKTTISTWPSKRLALRLSSLITREPYHVSMNHWMEHDGTRWEKDPVWDKCFPKFTASSKEDAIRQYWDYYYGEADVLQKKFGQLFRIIPTTDLSDEAKQADLLDFCGIPREQQKLVPAHIHKSSEGE